MEYKRKRFDLDRLDTLSQIVSHFLSNEGAVKAISDEDVVKTLLHIVEAIQHKDEFTSRGIEFDDLNKLVIAYTRCKYKGVIEYLIHRESLRQVEGN